MAEASRAGRGPHCQVLGASLRNAGPIPDADLRAALAAPTPDDIEEGVDQHAGMALGALVKIPILEEK